MRKREGKYDKFMRGEGDSKNCIPETNEVLFAVAVVDFLLALK